MVLSPWKSGRCVVDGKNGKMIFVFPISGTPHPKPKKKQVSPPKPVDKSRIVQNQHPSPQIAWGEDSLPRPIPPVCDQHRTPGTTLPKPGKTCSTPQTCGGKSRFVQTNTPPQIAWGEHSLPRPLFIMFCTKTNSILLVPPRACS